MFFNSRQRADGARYTLRLDVPVSEQVYDQITMLASLCDVTKTAYARRVLEIHALGALAVSQAGDPGEGSDVPESRMGGQGGGDKCTHRLDLPVTEQLYDAVVALAGLAGRPKADYIRWVLDQHLMGALAYSRARLGQ